MLKNNAFGELLLFSLLQKKQIEKMMILFISKHWVRCTHFVLSLYPLVSHYVGESPLTPPIKNPRHCYDGVVGLVKNSHREKS